MDQKTLALIGEVLTGAEEFISGQAVTVNVPPETINLGNGIAVTASAVITLKKS